MIPLSYAAILGGTCTLIGTSTNLVVQGMLIKARPDLPPLGHVRYLLGRHSRGAGRRRVHRFHQPLAAARSPAGDQHDRRSARVHRRDAGRARQSAGGQDDRDRPACGICRACTWPRSIATATSCPPFRRRKSCAANDRLLFVGIVESVVDLQRIRGLLPATDQVLKLSAPRPQRCLIEAVVSNSCPLVGKTIRDGRFRNTYNAVVVAVARNGERLHKKIGDIVLRPGDTLLVEAHPSFADQQRNSRDFFLVSRLDRFEPAAARSGLDRRDRDDLHGAVGQLRMDVDAQGLAAGGRADDLRPLRDAPRLARRSVDWEVLLADRRVVRGRHGAGENRRRPRNRRPHDSTGRRQPLDVAGDRLWRRR